MRKLLFPVFMAASVIGLSACDQSSSTEKSHPADQPAVVDQTNLCQVSTWRHDDVAKECKPGQKIVFLPDSFGNEQLPIIFAAVNCDLQHSVALTNGGVACIYTPITPKSAQSK